MTYSEEPVTPEGAAIALCVCVSEASRELAVEIDDRKGVSAVLVLTGFTATGADACAPTVPETVGATVLWAMAVAILVETSLVAAPVAVSTNWERLLELVWSAVVLRATAVKAVVSVVVLATTVVLNRAVVVGSDVVVGMTVVVGIGVVVVVGLVVLHSISFQTRGKRTSALWSSWSFYRDYDQSKSQFTLSSEVVVVVVAAAAAAAEVKEVGEAEEEVVGEAGEVVEAAGCTADNSHRQKRLPWPWCRPGRETRAMSRRCRDSCCSNRGPELGLARYSLSNSQNAFASAVDHTRPGYVKTLVTHQGMVGIPIHHTGIVLPGRLCNMRAAQHFFLKVRKQWRNRSCCQCSSRKHPHQHRPCRPRSPLNQTGCTRRVCPAEC